MSTRRKKAAEADGAAAVPPPAPLKKIGVPHEVTPANKQMVALGCFAGLTHPQIAAMLDISVTTLRAHYREELDNGEAKMLARVANNLFNLAVGAMNGNKPDNKTRMTSSIFIMKTRGRWRQDADAAPDPTVDENGVPLENKVVVRLKIGDAEPKG